jgi:Calcineurin-like phosphoesterase
MMPGTRYPLVVWLLIFAASNAAPSQQTKAAWVEFTSDGLSIRAIDSGDKCPTASIDGNPVQMDVRLAASDSFAITACQVMAPSGAKFAEVDGRKLKLSSSKTDRIVVIGDTGCRLKGPEVQDCNDPKKWPFKTVAQHAAAKHPDLVIHVGDYYYRETPCPADRPGCQGSPHGDSWESWGADFFEPAQSLLASAPWIFARGNHEQCGRGADGWFRLLDAGNSPLTCPAAAAPFTIELPGLELVVIDSADIADQQSSAARQAAYELQMPARSTTKSGETWIVTHKPLWAHELTKDGSQPNPVSPASGSEASATTAGSRRPMDHVDMMVAGHVHFFATIDFHHLGSAPRPAQLVVGDGGSALDSADTRSGEQLVDGMPAKFTVKDTFGYLLMDRNKNGWKATLYSSDDLVLATCTHRGRQMTCRPASK